MRTVAARMTAAGVLAWQLTTAPGAQAQGLSQRISVEFAAAVSTSSDAADDPFVFLDATATIRLTQTLDVIVRPYARRLPGGDWSKEMYQLQARYQPTTAIPLRIDAGIIASPLGIIALEMRQDRNPVIGNPPYYFSPLPSFDGRPDRLQLLSGGYPLGAMASLSDRRWDARVGVTDGTPTRSRRMMSSARPPARPQLVAGGGVTPIDGLRVGAGFSRGVYREPSVANSSSSSASVFNLEGEYAIGYSRFAVEWVRDSFETSTTPAVARGILFEAVRTLTPRWYVAGRTTRTSAPIQIAGVRSRRTAGSAETTIGYRLSPEITLKAGHQTSRTYAISDWNHAAVVSFVFFERWQ